MGESERNYAALHTGELPIALANLLFANLEGRMLSLEVKNVIYALSRIGESDKPSFFGSKYEKVLFISMLAMFVLIVISGIIFYFTKVPWLKFLALILTLAFYFNAMLWQLSLVIPILKFFRNPAGDFLKIVESSASKEVSSMTGLATVSTEAIQYVADRLVLAKQQLHARMAFLVGAVEKVGALPGVAASLLALSKVSESEMFKSNNESLYVYIALAFFVLYGFAVIGLMICQKFEIYVGVLQHYLQYRANNPLSGDAESGAR